MLTDIMQRPVVQDAIAAYDRNLFLIANDADLSVERLEQALDQLATFLRTILSSEQVELILDWLYEREVCYETPCLDND